VSIALPAPATCKLRGHAWGPGGTDTEITLTGTARAGLDVCARCGAVNEPRRSPAGYQPRHLRERT
jgi:hypothetical protein